LNLEPQIVSQIGGSGNDHRLASLATILLAKPDRLPDNWQQCESIGPRFLDIFLQGD